MVYGLLKSQFKDLNMEREEGSLVPNFFVISKFRILENNLLVDSTDVKCTDKSPQRQ